jgi:hypothetical protein
MSDADDPHGRLRNLAFSWEGEGEAFITGEAAKAVSAIRQAFDEHLNDNAYDDASRQPWQQTGLPSQDEPSVIGLTSAFTIILHRRGLLKIDPAPAD